MQTGNTYFIYRNELDKACFQHDTPYDKSKYLTKRSQPDKFLRDKTFKIASYPKHDGYQRGLASMVYKFFDKKSVEVVLTLNELVNLQMNSIDKLLENLRNEKFIHPLEPIFRVLIRNH